MEPTTTATALKVLGALLKPLISPLLARARKRRQLRAAVQAAAGEAGNLSPKHRDNFRLSPFIERDLLPFARRRAKAAHQAFDPVEIARLYLRRFGERLANANPLSVEAEVAVLSENFVEALTALLLEASEWQALVQGKLSLRAAKAMSGIVPTRPTGGWRAVADNVSRWTQRALSSPTESLSQIGQIVNLEDAAIGLKVPRPRFVDSIRSMIADNAGPVLVEGEDGVGKTWAAIEAAWIDRDPNDLILIVPARSVSRGGLERLLVEALGERAGRGSSDGWREWLGVWFPGESRRPAAAGRLVLLLDGVNQNANADWRAIVSEALSLRWAGGVQLVITARPRHARLISDIVAAFDATLRHVPVTGYDDGELAAALASAGRAGLLYQQVSPSLQALLRTPRYFRIAAKLWEEISDLEEVTARRLVLEDLRSRYSTGVSELTGETWAGLLAQLGEQVLSAPSHAFDAEELREALGRSGVGRQKVETSLQEIASGRLFREIGGGRFQLTEDLGGMAAGMAVAFDLLERRYAELPGVLDRIDELLPDLGSDVRGEALGSAAAILLCWDLPNVTPAMRSGLLVAWLGVQNPTREDTHEAAAYAPLHPVAYLDAYEAIAASSSPDRRALIILSDAIRPLARLSSLRALVLARALRWAGYVGLRDAFLSSHEATERAARSRRFDETLGETPAPGPRSVLGSDLVFLSGWNTDFLLDLVGRILRDAPLGEQVQLFRTAAIAASVQHGHDGWKALRWAARLNEVDPEAADEAFRTAARALAQIPADAELHHVAQGAARRMLDLVSGESEEGSMEALTGVATREWRTLMAQYDADPAKSAVVLQPDDVTRVSARGDMSPYGLMRRLQNHAWDPSRVFDASLRPAVVQEVMANWRPSALSAHMSQSSEDISVELYDLFLARLAPEVLRNLSRDFTAEVAGRSGAAFGTGLWRVRKVIAALDAEIIILLRSHLRPPPLDDQDEDDLHDVRRHLIELLTPFQSATGQMEILASEAHGSVPLSLDGLLRTPSIDEAADAIAAAAGRGERLAGVLAQLSLSDFQPAGAATPLLETYALSSEPLVAGIALQILARAPTADFAARLVASGWRWRPALYYENHYGSVILGRAGTSLPFDEILSRIAPWLITWVVHERGDRPEEWEAAAALLNDALAPTKTPDRLELGASVEVLGAKDPAAPSITLVRVSHSASSSEERFRLALDPEDRRARTEAGVNHALQRIRDAKLSGAVLYHKDIASTGLDQLAESFAEWTRRLLLDPDAFATARRSAQRLLVRMSEVLFRTEPELGARLWTAVVRGHDGGLAYSEWTGASAELDVLFSAPASAARDLLIDEVWDLNDGATDAALFALVDAAERAKASLVLDRLIEADLASPRPYRNARAWMAKSFRAAAPLDEGLRLDRHPSQSWVRRVRRAGAERAAKNAAARHWYRQFLTAGDPGEALAGWMLMLNVVDRRFYTWRYEVEAPEGEVAIERRLHRALAKDDLRRRIEANEKQLAGRFLEEAL